MSLRAQTIGRLLEEWRSRTCPACQGLKREGYWFCSDCYFALPMELRGPLYAWRGGQYEAAVAQAKQYLGERSARGQARRGGQVRA